jgi:hypothetical protein
MEKLVKRQNVKGHSDRLRRQKKNLGYGSSREITKMQVLENPVLYEGRKINI